MGQITLAETNHVTVTFCPMRQRYPKGHFFARRFPTCPDNTSASMKMYMDGIVLTKEAEVPSEQSVPLPLCPPEIWDRARSSVVKDRWLAPAP
jgi:hypothetical protein